MDYTVDTLPSRLTLGRQTETGVNDIRIDMSEWFKQWPELTISIWPTRPGEEAAYPADTYMDGSTIIWCVSNADTAIAGSGTVRIMGVANEQKKLSKIMTTYIVNTTTGVTTDPPEAAKPWVDGVAASAASAQQAAQRAENAAGEIKGISAVAQTLKPGQAATAEYADGVLVFGIPAGERGIAGEQGAKGDKGDTGPAGADAPQEAVLYTAQSLTDEQRSQARENIAAAGVARVEAVETALAGKLDNTPGTWPAWTADEQAAARGRIGIGDCELLEESVFGETVTYMSRNKDNDGNAYCLNAIIIYLVTEPDESNGTGRCAVYTDDGYVCDYHLGKLNNTQGSISTVKAYPLNGCWDSVARNADNNLQSTTGYANIMNGYIKPIVKTGYIKSFYISGKITAGSKLIVYGVRA